MLKQATCSVSCLAFETYMRSASVHCATFLFRLADPKIALLGAMQSLFETSMYTFVFLWTPALSPNGEHLEHGLIFSCFMMACMAGSTIAGRLLSDPRRYQISHYMKVSSSACKMEVLDMF